jgi:hypothetical protein
MNNERIYIRIHGENHRYIEDRVYEEEMDLTVAEFVELMKERRG